MKYRIRENSFWAKLAAKKLKSDQMAMVLGRTIHLYNTGHREFLNNRRWLRHELAHIRQFSELGFFGFLWRYAIESIRKGYRQNRFEEEARAAEWDDTLDQAYTFAPSRKQLMAATPPNPPQTGAPVHRG
ncbi:MAG: DUF4157 domain-containing protein [Flavihumibacter sp.]